MTTTEELETLAGQAIDAVFDAIGPAGARKGPLALVVFMSALLASVRAANTEALRLGVLAPSDMTALEQQLAAMLPRYMRLLTTSLADRLHAAMSAGPMN